MIIEANVPAMMTPQLVMMPPVRTTADPQPFDGAAAPLLLDHPGDQVDVVVLADGHQDDEQEQRQLPVQAAGTSRRRARQKSSLVTPMLTKKPNSTVRIRYSETTAAEHDDQHRQHGQRGQDADAARSRSR